MQRLIQKLSRFTTAAVLAIGLAVPLLASAPALAIPAQPGGTCFVHDLGGPATDKMGSCQSLGFTTAQTDSAGKHLDFANCYDITSTTSTTTINQVNCDDTSMAGGQVLCSENGKTVACPADSADPALSSGNCSTVSRCDLIAKYVNPFVNLLAALVGVAVVISIVVAGIQYGSSAGDAQKVAAAKARIRNAVIALVTFVFLYSLLNFLVPGGLGIL